MTKRVRAQRWVFTINNFTYEEEEAVRALETNDKVKSVVAEEEHIDDPEQTPHIQGYIHTTVQVYKTVVERWLGGRAFIEQARGSEQDNWKYCTKEGNVIVEKKDDKLLQSIKNPKNDEEAKQLLCDMRAMNEEDFEAAYPIFYMKHQALYRQFRHEALVKEQKTWDGNLKAKNLWIWGPPGTGKSRMARYGLKSYQIFSKAYNKWWNGYVQEQTKRIIIDDWPNADAGGNVLVQHLKIWADRYPFTAETKGGHIAVEPDYQLIITSNYPIEHCFTSDEDKEAIRRRFSEINWTDNKRTLDPYTVLSFDP